MVGRGGETCIPYSLLPLLSLSQANGGGGTGGGGGWWLSLRDRSLTHLLGQIFTHCTRRKGLYKGKDNFNNRKQNLADSLYWSKAKCLFAGIVCCLEWVLAYESKKPEAKNSLSSSSLSV